MEGMIGEIRLFGGNFAPRNWALCEGQLLSIAANTALFSILGTIYGGDGQTTFGLPDLRGRTAIGPGAGPGLPNYNQGAKIGSPETVLTTSNLPNHTHPVTSTIQANAVAAEGTSPTPSNTLTWAKSGQGDPDYASPAAGTVPLHPDAISVNTTLGSTGDNAPFTNMQPSLACYYIICLQGIFPSRS